MKRKGVRLWPKLLHNLRATRQTELAEQLAAHAASDRIGNRQAVAAKHYLQVTDEHFANAVGAPAVQKRVQHAAAEARNELHEEQAGSQKPREMRAFAAVCVSTREDEVGDTGPLRIDATACDAKISSDRRRRGVADSGAIAAERDLASVVAAWPQLTEAQRAAILAIVASARLSPEAGP